MGVRAETTYKAIEPCLEKGDYLVFCSDSIIEAANPNEDIFGFEQTAETIRTGCKEGLSAEALIDRLIV
ncbi:MAG: SpoIIE family protein phosphatase [Gemmatimonadetes bacterium]|nr:SpoIIE family protein phosphatase [Gemmatimonadota bacterium]